MIYSLPDIDECKADDSLCREGTYCENTQGSYTCKGRHAACSLDHMMSHEHHMTITPPTACHISCNLTCTGPGAGKCTECKDGYVMENESCVGE